jgi:hypothetical protein
MKTVLVPFSFAVAALLTATTTYSQETTPQRYSTTTFLSVPADKEAAFVENFKTGNGIKVARARMKSDATITGFSVRRAVYGGYPAPRANYIIVTQMSGPPAELDVAKRDALYRATIGMTYAEYMQKVRPTGEVVGSTLSHVHNVTPDYQLAEGDVVLARRLKTTDGKTQELSTLNTTLRLPLMTERVKSGNLKGWAFSHLTFPNGTALAYDATEILVFKDMATAVGNGGGGNGNNAMNAFIKLFPNGNYNKYRDDQRECAKLIRTDVYRVVVALSQGTPVSALR